MESQQNLLAEENMQIDPTVADNLKETAKWAKFVAIAGFIFGGLIFIFAFYYYNLVTKFNSLGSYRNDNKYLLIILIYAVIAIVWIITSVYQLRFASKMLVALENNDQDEMQRSFLNLKIYYRISGIITIISLLFAFLGLLGIMSEGGS